MDDRDEEPVVIYHSHTATEAYPSRTDVSYASEPEAHYVLVSTRDADEVEFRSYRIVDGNVTEEEVRVAGPGDTGAVGTADAAATGPGDAGAGAGALE
jgi:proteasome lid subunit RPN8/RPN11